MNKRIGSLTTIGATIALSLACGPGSAQDLGKLGSMIPGGGSMTSGSMGNVAGLLEYCMKNNFLGGDSGASGIKDQLMGKLGGGGTSTGTVKSGQSSDPSQMFNELTGSAKHKSTTSSGGSATSDPSYLSGAKGILQGSNGQSMDLNTLGGGSSDLKSQLTTKVCDTVLKQGKSFLHM
ncbi:DUF2501 domain-containing protein [Dyella solisilvae]|uniref:DUF2501 domain-containing protein n=1 Tax=Dyella solisilvae TaxID=1920168 RepID=A0A370K8M8_9GAMM|nr:DUF2501 domain-containing protein [Dyella solisilvae]RDI99008.1 DUF2501 domain-containing protein [Dyella solisilvae]